MHSSAWLPELMCNFSGMHPRGRQQRRRWKRAGSRSCLMWPSPKVLAAILRGVTRAASLDADSHALAFLLIDGVYELALYA